MEFFRGFTFFCFFVIFWPLNIRSILYSITILYIVLEIIHGSNIMEKIMNLRDLVLFVSKKFVYIVSTEVTFKRTTGSIFHNSSNYHIFIFVFFVDKKTKKFN